MASSTAAAGWSDVSLATGQRAVHDPQVVYPLWPPVTTGCRSPEGDAYPLEIDFAYDDVDPALFDRGCVASDISTWAPLLPPLDPRLRLGIGGTPLLDGTGMLGSGCEVWLKDESRNPTWSHKDRLNLCTVSAAVASGAPGVVVASSGNHGASVAALAARAGLACVVVTSPGMPPVVRSAIDAHEGRVVSVDQDDRWGVVAEIVDRHDYQPLSNRTTTHTGHPFGPEGYKTIAYEVYLQLGRRTPAAVFVPTGYGELLFGVWKGFEELRLLGVSGAVPALYAAEVAGPDVLRAGLRTGRPIVGAPPAMTDAYSLAVTTGGYRGLHVMRRTSGRVVGLDDAQLRRAQRLLATRGLWQELSGAAGVAALDAVLRDGTTFDGPVVCLCTASGMKDRHAHRLSPGAAETSQETLSWIRGT